MRKNDINNDTLVIFPEGLDESDMVQIVEECKNKEVYSKEEIEKYAYTYLKEKECALAGIK